ncbi:hypothetical protein F5Y00DRAFT_220402 [Daldinia vernicosa]|uniref:uncharacterized protein n=1 Tax=Daldinia vernicosa TaxID=114800 RepID=UPI00200747C1|nr:uncharacterized protein F5Y00DRAFT_220402 [Daldinia vernicosa]KAI0843927.1 hypothetical protein F5Y00DRAFT_220402 [Daldinia vernicosa]
MANSLAQLGVQYMPSTGGCMLDLAAIPSHLFNSCSAVHIRIPEAQHHVEVNSDMICIKPSQPAPGPGAAIYREQYMYPNVVVPTDLPHASPKNHKQQPPSFNAPETPIHHPVPEPDDIKPANPDTPNDSQKDSAPSLRTFAKTTHRSTITNTHTASLSPQVTHVLQSPTVTTTSCTTHLHTPGPSTTAPVVHAPMPSTLTTRTILPSPPPPPSPSQDSPTPSSQPARPAVVPPPFPLPEPEPQPEAGPDPTPIPDPELGSAPPNPGYCGETYFKMEFSHIETLDPHDLDTYLNLLGVGDLGLDPGLDLEHGISGFVSSLLSGAVDDDSTRGVWRELERSYRVRCGVSVQELWSSSSRDAEGQVEFIRSMGSQMECLQECEKSAIGAAARDGDVKECLGAAWSWGLERDNCRFWTGGRDEFLPVERLKGGERGEWDLVYL